MCSLDVLKERISNMKEQNEKEHKSLIKNIWVIETKLDVLIDKLDKKFVLRKEFKVWIGIVWLFATILWIIWYFN